VSPIEQPLRHHTDVERAWLAARHWDDATLVARVAEHCATRPNAVAIVDGRQISYAELDADSERICRVLIGLGVKPGHVVAVQLPNWYEFGAIALGILKAGGIVNPLVPAYRESELAHMLSTGRTRVLFTPSTYRGNDYRPRVDAVRARTGLPEHHLCVRRGDVRFAGYVEGDKPVVSKRPADPSEIMFTSGTEALPKAVVHSERTLCYSSRATWAALGLCSDDVVWMPAPLGHSTGFNHGLRLGLYHRLPVVLQEVWDPDEAVRLVTEHRPTHTLLSPTFLADLLAAADRASGEVDLSSLRLFGCGGAPVAPRLVEAAALHGIGCHRLYGATEFLLATWNRPEDTANHLDTDGVPLPGVEVRTCDSRGDAVVEKPGTIYVRSPSCCEGFVGPSGTIDRHRFADGWITSGDVGLVNALGALAIVGRTKDIIIRGGVNIAPREVEDLLEQMPEVQQVAVVGVPHHRLGEIGCACIVLAPGATLSLERIRAHADASGLAKHKWPERLEIFDAFPRTSVGKIRRAELRARIA
jgi:acyl-CoA synthetase (AMP-forming)/AMP-acid ligase II